MANFADEARVRFPWLQGALLNDFSKLWSETGDPTAALGKLRQTDRYQRTFQGIRRDDGTLRMDENEYMSTMVGYRVAFEEFGLDASQFSQKDFVRMIEREVSAQEAFQAASQAQRFREPGAQDNGLANAFVRAFINSGSAVAALEDVRRSDAYQKVFAGNIRDDGSLRMDEQEYFGYKRGFERLFLNRGLNPQPFEASGKLTAAIEAEMSLNELDGRMTAIEQGVFGGTEETSQWFLNAYGERGLKWLSQNGDRASALAMAFDQDVGNELLQNRITAAQIGGEAALRGFERGVLRAEELARRGVNLAQASQFFAQAEQSLNPLDAVTRRFNAGGLSLTQFEDASLLGGAEQRRRLERGLRAEGSLFTGQNAFRRDQSGALSGLLPR